MDLNSTTKIAIRMQPIWNGEATMYDTSSGKIEIQVAITNNSNKPITIGEVFLMVKKKGVRFLSFEEFPICTNSITIAPNQTFNFDHDLKEFLKNYGEKRKFAFAFKGEDTEIRTSIITMNQFNSTVKSLYNFHF